MSDVLYEKIVVKPPIDLIPDEYEVTNKIAVHAFTSSSREDRDRAKLFLEALRGNGYEIDEVKNIHCMDDENIKEFLDNINRDAKDVDGLILYFSYLCKNDGIIYVWDGENITYMRIQEVVKKFTAYFCTGLKNKPKVFIFDVKTPSQIQTDSLRYAFSYDLTYDTPGEADMLVVYKKTEKLDSLDFTSQLCDNIKKYGNTEDIYSLVTSVDCALGDSRPLVISTLTRKFYLTPSDHRGHHFHIRQYHDAITKHLEEIKDKLRKAEISGKTKHSADLKRGATPKTNLSPRNGTGSRNPSNRLASLVETVGGSRTSANGPVSSVESDGGSSSRSTSGKRRTAPSRTSANRADEGSSSRTAAGGRLSSTNTSRSRLSSTKSDGNLTSTVPTVKDRWKY